MSKGKKKTKKAAPVGSSNPHALQSERDEKRMAPLARRLLIAGVVLVAAAQLLNMAEVLPDPADIVLMVIGLVVLLAGLAVQGHSGNGGGARLP